MNGTWNFTQTFEGQPPYSFLVNFDNGYITVPEDDGFIGGQLLSQQPGSTALFAIGDFNSNDGPLYKTITIYSGKGNAQEMSGNLTGWSQAGAATPGTWSAVSA